MNILVIGNGFDLAHGLPTKYEDFLKWIEVILQIISIDEEDDLNSIDWKNISTTIKCIIEKNRSSIVKKKDVWDKLFEKNIWIRYFLDNKIFLKDNWIDFESEISKVIQSLEFDLNGGDNKHDLDDFIYTLSNYDLKYIYHKFFDVENDNNEVNTESVKNKYIKISFRDLRDILINDLNRLIKALEIYLLDYIQSIECDWFYSNILTYIPDNVLSFNYTNTYERLYGDNNSKTDYEYIHGKANSNNINKPSNMVLGINEYLSEERKNQNIDFIF